MLHKRSLTDYTVIGTYHLGKNQFMAVVWVLREYKWHYATMQLAQICQIGVILGRSSVIKFRPGVFILIGWVLFILIIQPMSRWNLLSEPYQIKYIRARFPCPDIHYLVIYMPTTLKQICSHAFLSWTKSEFVLLCFGRNYPPFGTNCLSVRNTTYIQYLNKLGLS